MKGTRKSSRPKSSGLDINTIMARNLLRLRRNAGLTQEQLADMVGARPTDISAMEHNRNRPIGKVFVEKVCNALNVRPYELYWEEQLNEPFDAGVEEMRKIYNQLDDYNRDRLLETAREKLALQALQAVSPHLSKRMIANHPTAALKK